MGGLRDAGHPVAELTAATLRSAPPAAFLSNELSRLQMLQAGARKELGEPYAVWRRPDGSVWARFFRAASEFIIRFEGVADFGISAEGGCIWCSPEPDCGSEHVLHLFANQVLPLAYSMNDTLVLHASAVQWRGRVFAFAGASGQGKSTLAVRLAAAGCSLVSDDSLVVTMSRGAHLASPIHGAVRLRADSVAQLRLPNDWAQLPGGFHGKVRLAPSSCVQDRALPLAAVFFLGTADEAVRLQPCSKAAAALALVRNSFLLESGEPAKTAAHFARAASAAEAVRCHHLSYARNFASMRTVVDAVKAAMQEGSSP